MNRSRFAFIFASALTLAGCGQFVGSTPPPVATVRSETAPPQCKNQHTRPKYAQIRLKLKTRANSFCVPEFHGFGGTIEYPGVERRVELVLRSSTKNIYDEPLLGYSGAPIFYLNLHFLAGTHFGTKLKSAGGFTGANIQAGQPYAAFGIVTVGHLVLRFPPCYAVATQGPYGGVLPGLGELFSDTTITGAGYGVIEIYPGMQVSQEC
ncbi:MAG: hypothetical protein ABSD52_04920 [Candidatus Cybelea sp.]|jgi:hypothetical protein